MRSLVSYCNPAHNSAVSRTVDAECERMGDFR